jgi:hypothetical protein
MGRASIFLAFVLAGIWHFTGHYVWEFGRAILYEKVWHMIEPSVPAPFLFQYGPSAFLVLLGALLWWDAKGRPKFWQSSRGQSTESSSRSLMDDWWKGKWQIAYPPNRGASSRLVPPRIIFLFGSAPSFDGQ